jgi:hypothetical protein
MATPKSDNGQSISPYKIERNIPVQGRARNSEAWKRYPLEKMKIGDSFLMKESDPNAKPHLVQPAVKNYNRVFGTKIECVSRLQPDGGRRVWRIK